MMRGIVTGKVVKVEDASWVADGETVRAFEAYLANDNPLYGADRFQGPADIAPKEGENVVYACNFRARVSKAGNPWLSVWALERVQK